MEFQFDPADVEKNKSMTIIAAIFPILFFLPMVSDSNSAYGKFHANSALLVLLYWIVAGIVYSILASIFGAIFLFAPFLDLILVAIIGIAVWGSCFALWIIELVAACKVNAKPLPVIGKIVIIK